MPRSRGFKFAARGTQGTPLVKLMPAAAGQNFVKGQPVRRGAGNLLVPALTTETGIIGVANEWVTNSDLNRPVEVIIADNDTVFKVRTTPAPGVPLAPTDIGRTVNSDAVDGLIVDKATLADNRAWIIVNYDNGNNQAWVKLAPTFRAQINN